MAYKGRVRPTIALTAADIAADAVGSSEIAAGAVDTAEIATNAVTANEIAAGAVAASEIAATFDISSKTVTLPAAAVTAHVTAYDDSDLQNDIALLGFKVASNDSSVKFNLANQVVDDFQDTSGVSAGDSTNEGRNATGKYYEGAVANTPSVSGNYDTNGTDGSYSWYKWTTTRSDGTYTTDTAQDYEYLVIAGGGGGGGQRAGGGGAGGYRTATGLAVAATTIGSITVGAGGAGGIFDSSNGHVGANGSNSVFSTITSAGGGGGAGGQGVGSFNNGLDGGSGGGGGANDGTGGSGNTPSTSPVQGYGGGDVTGNGGGAGGGGASAAAGNMSGTTGTAGGAGTSSSIDGSAATRGGGGGGGSNAGSAGAGGAGGGGAGSASGTATAGTVNTGGGGGGGGNSAAGGVGGSGIVIIKRLTTGTAPGNMTLVSTSTTAEVAPTKGDLVFSYSDGAGTATYTGGSPTIQAFISRNGAAYSSAVTLSKVGTAGGNTILAAHDVDLSGITSGTAMRYKITTTGQSTSVATRIHAVSLGWS